MSITRENASARPARIMVLIVLPSKDKTTNAASVGDGNRQQHRAGGSGAAQKYQNDDADQHQSRAALMQHRVDRFLDEHGLIEDDIGDQLLGQVEQVPVRFADVVDHLDGVAVSARLHDRDVGGLLAVDADDVVLQLARVLGLADVAHRNPACAHGLDGYAIQIGDVLHQAVGVDIEVGGSDLDVAGGQDQVAVVDGADHVHHAQLPRQQLEGIDVDHRLPVLAAEHRGNFSAVDDRNLIADLELRQIVKLGFGQALAL